MVEPSNIFPTAVLVAIALFLVRELVEISRKRKSKNRKIGAFKAILGEEIERNYWAWKSLKRALDYIKADLQDNLGFKYEIRLNPSGATTFRACYDDGVLASSHVLPEASREGFTRVVAEVAELDNTFYQLARNAYDEIAEIAHVRSSLMNELGEDEPSFLRGMVDYGIETLEEGLPAIQQLYKFCAGKDLTSHKLR